MTDSPELLPANDRTRLLTRLVSHILRVGLAPPVDAAALARDLGITISVDDIDGSAYSFWDDREARIITSKHLDTASRHFVIAHEIGHLADPSGMQLSRAESDLDSISVSNISEEHMLGFALRLLVPITMRSPFNYPLALVTLSAHFNLPVTAAVNLLLTSSRIDCFFLLLQSPMQLHHSVPASLPVVSIPSSSPTQRFFGQVFAHHTGRLQIGAVDPSGRGLITKPPGRIENRFIKVLEGELPLNFVRDLAAGADHPNRAYLTHATTGGWQFRLEDAYNEPLYEFPRGRYLIEMWSADGSPMIVGRREETPDLLNRWFQANDCRAEGEWRSSSGIETIWKIQRPHQPVLPPARDVDRFSVLGDLMHWYFTRMGLLV